MCVCVCVCVCVCWCVYYIIYIYIICVQVDAEWHRDQPWALKNEHIGKPVRWGVAAQGDDDG